MKRVGVVTKHIVPGTTAASVFPVEDTDSSALLMSKSDRTRQSMPMVNGKAGFDAVEWEARCKLAMAYRLADHYGWDQIIYNHITVKVPGSDKAPGGPFFLINPLGLRFDEVTASSLLKVDLEGNIVDKGSDRGPLLKQGFVVHSAIHIARPDLHCVWHCHHKDTVAVLTTKTGLLPLYQESFIHHGHVSYHPFEGTAVDLEERHRMAQNLGPKNRVLLMENHGPLTAGETVEEAFYRMYYITLVMTWQAQAMALVGGDLSKMNIPSGEYLEKLKQRREAGMKKKSDAVDAKNELIDEVVSMWHAMRRKMEDKHGAENIYC
eukprot:gnl/MRDRNA2_/MRDRNA2_33722_c0_seq1.p1 gnl/MRDRNA2_/MRDRNA2_33722_c0~~gnl/MRDRNA2_/MRDRNA2_33722_c0_seq1.p1  ORF type:complete len:321 (-),score=53.81 gnl/MRDRNA2_/MRDRNA2_33722_c0_seq1:346-1308(-)